MSGLTLSAYEEFTLKLIAAEKRASDAERTFADLRNLIAVNLAANAELVRRTEAAESELSCRNGELIIARAAVSAIDRERDEAVRRAEEACAELDKMTKLVWRATSERDEARAALGKVVEALRALWAKTDLFKLPDDLIEQVRTALTHTGNDG